MQKGSKMTLEQRQRVSRGVRRLFKNGMPAEHRKAIGLGLKRSTIVRDRKGRPPGVAAKSKEWVGFRNHRISAKRRGIPFLLTFNEWFGIWVRSRKFHLRGNRRGCYVMARHGDQGAYELGNVSIILTEENSNQAHTGNKYNLGRKQTKEERKRRGESCKRFWATASEQRHAEHSIVVKRSWKKRRRRNERQ